MSTVVSEEEFKKFRERVVAIRAMFDALPRGTQQIAAFDIRIAPARVSGVLNGRYYDLPALEKLEAWCSDQGQSLLDHSLALSS